MTDGFTVFNGILLAGFSALNFAHGHRHAATIAGGLVDGGIVTFAILIYLIGALWLSWRLRGLEA